MKWSIWKPPLSLVYQLFLFLFHVCSVIYWEFMSPGRSLTAIIFYFWTFKTCYFRLSDSSSTYRKRTFNNLINQKKKVRNSKKSSSQGCDITLRRKCSWVWFRQCFYSVAELVRSVIFLLWWQSCLLIKAHHLFKKA